MTRMRKKCAPIENASDFSETSPAASRATWTGCLRIGAVIAPVRAYPSVKDDDGPELHQFHRGCGKRIQCPRMCPKHGALASEDIVKGIESANGKPILMDEDALRRLRPPKDEELVLERFIAEADLDPIMYSGRHLYIAPASKVAATPFGLMVGTLSRLGKLGVGQLTVNGRKSLVAVMTRAQRLTLHFLHYPGQIRSVPAFDVVTEDVSFGAPLVEQFVNERNSHVDWSGYQDPVPGIVDELINTHSSTRRGRKKSIPRAPAAKADRCNPTKATTSRLTGRKSSARRNSR
ncbi:MAG: DNA end-binding protein Ku [Planctomycetaceae bacterium]|jgi:DNA end-binding protein Ku